jgi:hypothetical protein
MLSVAIYYWYTVSIKKSATESRVPSSQVKIKTSNVLRSPSYNCKSLRTICIGDDHRYVPSVVVKVLLSSFMIYRRIFNTSNWVYHYQIWIYWHFRRGGMSQKLSDKIWVDPFVPTWIATICWKLLPIFFQIQD